ncbi:MAG: hypothetical protein ACYC35_05220 [Pirellulales bacterium]
MFAKLGEKCDGMPWVGVVGIGALMVAVTSVGLVVLDEMTKAAALSRTKELMKAYEAANAAISESSAVRLEQTHRETDEQVQRILQQLHDFQKAESAINAKLVPRRNSSAKSEPITGALPQTPALSRHRRTNE